MTRRQQIEQLITELEGCRGLLVGEAPRHAGRRPRRAPASG